MMDTETVRGSFDRIRWLCALVDRMDRKLWTKDELSIVLLNIDIIAKNGVAASGIADPDARAISADASLALDEDMAALAEAIQPERRRKRDGPA